MLNAYFGRIVPLMERAGGEVHQIVGDELMVVFGKDASVSRPRAPRGASGADAPARGQAHARPSTTTGRASGSA